MLRPTAVLVSLVATTLVLGAVALPGPQPIALVPPVFAEEPADAIDEVEVELVAPVRRRRAIEGGGSCPNFSPQSYFKSKKMTDLPIKDPYTTRPSTIFECGLQELHRYCVAEINAYRSGKNKFSDGTTDPDVIAGRSQLIEVGLATAPCGVAQAICTATHPGFPGRSRKSYRSGSARP